MAIRGQFKAPIESLDAAYRRAWQAIEDEPDGVALFMVGGALMITKRRSTAFAGNLIRLQNHLIGVYDNRVDIRQVRDDISVFYQQDQVTGE